MPKIIRDRFTWLAYVMLGYFAYLQASLGPIMSFLRSELALSYSLINLHLSAFAFGMVLAGLTGDQLARRWGRKAVFWAGGGGMGMGAVLLALGATALATISAAFAMGFTGTWLLVMIQAALGDRHGEQRAIALTEANVLASAAAGLAPLLVGGLERLNLGWRSALLLAVVVWVILAAFFRREAVPLRAAPAATGSSNNARLPAVFWGYWTVVLFAVSVEWCIIAWGADFLEQETGLPKADASALMSTFFVAMLVGRAAGSRLTRTLPASMLLLGAVCMALVSFPIFWLSASTPLTIAGLFVTGLGVSNLFPLTLSAASQAAAANSNAASARISLAAGSAILVTPQVLAAIADQVGIKNAYSVVAALLVVVLVVTVMANRAAQRETMHISSSWR